ncbi:adenylate/guanylate cyclase domain-containing protein [Leptospira sp. GIMC2001]|uniref:adenylate/guanylate cyclase domain-containing protein n=1 Tax=Leptospira sp. GIMC2001 TaxID=1513297 RepID=UPI00234B0CB9|nr:adenylate/guanylate cyclase domain-containing protein [Leptospira sp. GIMC2001]WCL49711.1 HAMP domain-containing protein [Leptospira sp. GIMC2001]
MLSKIKRFIYNWSVQLKLVTIISVIIILSISVIIYIATYFFRQDNELRIKEKNLEITELIASKTKSDISNIVRSSRSLARLLKNNEIEILYQQSSVPGFGDISEVEEILAIYIIGFEQKNPVIYRKIYNPVLLADNKLQKKKIDAKVFSNLKVFSTLTKGKTVVRNLSIESTPLMGVSHQDLVGSEKLTFIAVTKMDQIQATFKSLGISDNFMISDDGGIISHTDLDLVLKSQDIKDLSIFEKIQDSPINNGQVKYSDKENKVYIASFKKIGIADLVVVATVPEEKAMEEVNNIQRRNFFLMIIILNLSILIVLIFSKNMTKPILRLVDAAKNIEKGNFNVNIQESSGDEIGILTRSFVNMGKGLSERDKIKDAFGKFVNTELAEKAMSGSLALGGTRRECTIFFSDIRNFTAISEQLEPEAVVEFLNDYMTEMVSCINRMGGIVDKFIGDSIMAIWGAINSTKNDTERAIDTAIMMRNALIQLNAKRRSNKKPFIRIGIGINTGPVIAGQIGSEERLEFTVIGDAVNLASRIEALNKDFNTDILISESAYHKVSKLYKVVKMKEIKVKGKVKKQIVYAVLGRVNDKDCPKSIAEVRKLISDATPTKKSKVRIK